MLAAVQVNPHEQAQPPPPPYRGDANDDVVAASLFSPGFCYLALFQQSSVNDARDFCGHYPLNWKVKYWALLAPTHLHTGFFRLVFGTPASVERSDKFLAHIVRVAEGSSLLRARDVLQLVPDHARWGLEQDEAQPLPAMPTQAPQGLPPSLGTIFDPRRRTFNYRLASLKFNQKGRVAAWDPNVAPVRTFAEYSVYAAFEELSIVLHPGPTASRVAVQLSLAWYPHVETAPASDDEFEAKPTHERHVLQSQYPGGAAPTLTTHCPMVAGIQKTFRPNPHFGGAPRLAYLARYTVVSKEPPPEESVVYDIFARATVVLHPDLL